MSNTIIKHVEDCERSFSRRTLEKVEPGKISLLQRNIPIGGLCRPSLGSVGVCELLPEREMRLPHSTKSHHRLERRHGHDQSGLSLHADRTFVISHSDGGHGQGKDAEESIFGLVFQCSLAFLHHPVLSGPRNGQLGRAAVSFCRKPSLGDILVAIKRWGSSRFIEITWQKEAIQKIICEVKECRLDLLEATVSVLIY